MEGKTESLDIKPESKEKGLERYFKYFAGVGIILGVVGVIAYSRYNPEFPLFWVVVIIVGLVAIALLSFFGFGWKKKYEEYKKKHEEEDRIPPPASKERVMDVMWTALTNDTFYNHVKEVQNITPHNIGDNLIYDFKVKPLYSKPSKDDVVHIIINANYLDRIPAVIFNPTATQRAKSINAMSTKPKDEPDTEVTRSSNAMFGTETETVKRTRP